MLRGLSLTLLFLPGLSWAEEDQEKPGIAALQIKAVAGMSTDVAGMFSEAILSQLKESGRFSSVLGSSDVQAMLDLEQQKQALNCDENNCLAQLGGALGVPYLLTASLGKVGGKLMLNIKIIAVDEAQVVNRLTRIFKDEGALLEGLHGVVDGLLAGAFKVESPPASPPPAAVSAESPKAPAAAAKKPPWLALGLGLVGAGVTAFGYRFAAPIQAEFAASPNSHLYDILESDVAMANTIVAGGWSLVAAAGFTWWWTR